MDSIAMCIAAGTVLGFLTGLGIGGGSLLILWLTQVLTTPQAQAQGINLLFFLPAAAVSCLFRRKQGLLRWDIVLAAALPGCVAAGLCAWLAASLDETLLKKIFGYLLLGAGLWELLGSGKLKGKSKNGGSDLK